MKLVINLEKKYAYVIMGLLVLAIGMIGVNVHAAYVNPANNVGHSADEVNLSEYMIRSEVEAHVANVANNYVTTTEFSESESGSFLTLSDLQGMDLHVGSLITTDGGISITNSDQAINIDGQLLYLRYDNFGEDIYEASTSANSGTSDTCPGSYRYSTYQCKISEDFTCVDVYKPSLFYYQRRVTCVPAYVLSS